MKFRKLGNTELKISEISFGTGTFGWTCDKKEAFRIMDLAFDRGINFFDSADVYPVYEGRAGLSEKIVGEWNKSRRNKKIIIATKVGEQVGCAAGRNLSRSHIHKSVDKALRRLQVETIDLYQTHGEDKNTPLEETFRAFDEIIRAGKVRYLGVSNYSVPTLKTALKLKESGLPVVSSFQLHYNLLSRHLLGSALINACRSGNVGIIAYSVLARGMLSGKYMNSAIPDDRLDSVNKYCTRENIKIIEKLKLMAEFKKCAMSQLAISWALSNPAIVSAIIGASAPAELEESLKYGDVIISKSEKDRLEKLSTLKA